MLFQLWIEPIVFTFPCTCTRYVKYPKDKEKIQVHSDLVNSLTKQSRLFTSWEICWICNFIRSTFRISCSCWHENLILVLGNRSSQLKVHLLGLSGAFNHITWFLLCLTVLGNTDEKSASLRSLNVDKSIFNTTEETPSDDEDHVIQLKVASCLKKLVSSFEFYQS